MRVLVVNPGSSTLKVALVSDHEARESANVAADEGAAELRVVLERWGPVDAVGVRFVHGGPDRLEPVRVDDAVLGELDAAADLAPLHNPPALAATRAVREAWPDLPVVACFDTAFHRTLPPEAAVYAIPREWNRRWRLRRYGFHGLSHEYAAGRAAEMIGRPLEELKVVTCHLGGGASLCAVDRGRSVDTTMGFTPLAGLVMQVRSGSVDPGLVLWLQQHAGLSLDEVADGLEHNAGLKGLTGTSGDIREVVEGARAGDADCATALDIYIHRLAREIGGMVVSAGGLDALVFTGGVGEHSALVRARVADRLAFLGLALDPDRNRPEESGDHDLTGPGSAVRVLVVASREDLQIAANVEHVLRG
ncbi:acetate/propionate family kinase [Nocardioides sp. DS6]|uniref:Acetate kinase n=1 Tax=Nocardioides eburneus TaxID=3231482 RepID=A0ABV3T2D8_9ACTN